MSIILRFLVRTSLFSIIFLANSLGLEKGLFAQQNLLTLEKVSLDAQASSTLANEPQLRDEQDSTVAAIQIDTGQSLDLVYQFPEVVTVKNAVVTTEAVSAKKARIEILASTLSSTTGFHSLRVEPLNASSRGKQRFSFEQAAARWLMIRITPTDADSPLSVSIAELELNGYVGIPKSTYLFDKSPADAIEVLSRLSGSIDLKLSTEEKQLFDDARDGKLDETSFAEASLLSSGVVDDQRRRSLLAKIDELEEECKRLIPKDLSDFERGERLLEYLHSGPFGQGYVEAQTDVSTVLDQATFNCVSSATLFNILARRMGLDARGIEVPDHAFSILYDGTNHVDVETTNKRGFNPARNRQGLDSFQQATGFVYIPDSNRSKRREVGEAGMVALSYYNHGVTALKEKQFDAAMVKFFKALSLDPNNKSAVKNVLASLGSWSRQLYDEGQTENALEVLQVGRELAPNDRQIRHNHKAIWQRHVQSLVDSGKADEALKQLVAAVERTQDSQLAELQSWVFVLKGQKLVTAKNWKEALANVDEGLKVVDELARKDLVKWKDSIVFSWSSELIDQKKFSETVDVLEIGLKDSSNYRLQQRLAYVAQEWGKQEAQDSGSVAAHTLINKLAKKFPKNYRLKKVAGGLADREAQGLIDAEDFESALKVYQGARKLNPDNRQFKEREKSVWLMMGKPHIDAKQWDKAADVYERALQSLPTERAFKKNLAYVVQEKAADIFKNEGVVAAETAIASMADRFPKINEVQKQKGTRIKQEVASMIKAGEFDSAEELLTVQQGFFRNKRDLSALATNLYYLQAKPHLDAKQWSKAIEIFSKGNNAFPNNAKIKSNLEYAWISSAKTLLDEENWQQAATIYREAAKSLPSSSKIRNNLRFCEGKLKTSKE